MSLFKEIHLWKLWQEWWRIGCWGSWKHNHIPKNLFTLRWKLKVVQELHFEWFILTLTEVEKKLSVDQFSDSEFLKFCLAGQTKFRNGRGASVGGICSLATYKVSAAAARHKGRQYFTCYYLSISKQCLTTFGSKFRTGSLCLSLKLRTVF